MTLRRPISEIGSVSPLAVFDTPRRRSPIVVPRLAHEPETKIKALSGWVSINQPVVSSPHNDDEQDAPVSALLQDDDDFLITAQESGEESEPEHDVRKRKGKKKNECAQDGWQWMEEKYLDHYGYLNYLRGTEDDGEHRTENSLPSPASIEINSAINAVGHPSDRDVHTDARPTKTKTLEEGIPSQIKAPLQKIQQENASASRPVAADNDTIATDTMKPNLGSAAFFHPTEIAWIRLFHRKIKDLVESGIIIRTPSMIQLRDSFNAFIANRILQDRDGNDLPPRAARNIIAMRKRINSVTERDVKQGRETVAKLLEARHSEDKKTYVPVITEQELEDFIKDGTVAIDDPTDPEKNAALMDAVVETDVVMHERKPLRRKLQTADEGASVSKKQREA